MLPDQPDTAAIRAYLLDEPHGDPLYDDMLVVLDALDAANAELGKHKSLAELSRVSAEISNARAEAAEADAHECREVQRFKNDAAAQQARAERWEHDYWRALARAEAAEARFDAMTRTADQWQARAEAALVAERIAAFGISATRRAEAAVAVTERLTGELDAAEARIAAALDIYGPGDGAAFDARLMAIRRTLTGDAP